MGHVLLTIGGAIVYLVLTVYCFLSVCLGTWIWGCAFLLPKEDMPKGTWFDEMEIWLTGCALPTLPVLTKMFPNHSDNTYIFCGMGIFWLACLVWTLWTGYIAFRIVLFFGS